MDRRSLLLLIVTCAILVLWYPLMNRIYPPQPLPQTNLVAGATVTNSAAPQAVAPDVHAPPGYTTTGFPQPGGEPAEVLELDTPEARYFFSSHGGGLSRIELKHFADAIDCRERRNGEEIGRAVLNRFAPTPIFALLGLDPDGNAPPEYDLSLTNGAVIATRDLGNGLRVVKEFRPGTNHVLHVTTRLQNWLEVPRLLPQQEWVFGTAAPLHPGENAMYRGLYTYDGDDSEHIGESWFANRFLGCFPGTPRAAYLGETTNTVWAAVHNQFFATIVIPRDRSGRVYARHITLPSTNGPARNPNPGFQAALLYPAEEIPARQERVREFDLYIGPKEYNTVSSLGNNTDVVMGFDNYFGGRFSGFFARSLLLAMNGLHGLGLSYALAIIAITVFVRLLFWPLMKASARTSKRMAALQPQIKELQEKYKDNPQKMNQKMLELWREHKINPAAGCLPILIQFPILLGFYAMLQTAIELRGASFLWACDLSQPDTIAVIPGINFPINPLPLLMGVTMLLQARLTPMSPTMDATQQRIMRYMPLMFMVFLYNFSAGLTLYWTVSNLLSILQMKLTRAKDDPVTPPGAPATRPAAGVRRPSPFRKNRPGGGARNP